MPGYTTTLSSVASIARELAGTDANGLTAQKVFDYANMCMLRLRKMLILEGVDAASVQETQGTITDGTGEYLYPSDMWLPKEMELNWWNTSGSTAQVNNLYVPLGRVSDVNLPSGSSVSWLRQNQAQLNPLVDFRGDYFEIFPTPNATTWGGSSGSTLSNAFRFWYYLQPTLYTDNTGLTDSLTYPENLDYHAFADLIANTYKLTVGRITEADLETVFQLVAKNLVKMIKGGGSTFIATQGIPWTGYEF